MYKTSTVALAKSIIRSSTTTEMRKQERNKPSMSLKTLHEPEFHITSFPFDKLGQSFKTQAADQRNTYRLIETYYKK